MCLKDLKIPKQSRGVGWKIVRKTADPNVFKPEWSRFSELGGTREDHYGLTTPNTVYILGKTTKADVPDYLAVTYNTHKKYKPGIHVYLKKEIAIGSISISSPDYILIKVNYYGAKWSDGDVVVCNSVRVLRVEYVYAPAEPVPLMEGLLVLL